MTVLVLPGLLPYAEALALRGRVRRLAPSRGIPEAAWVGLAPLRIADGPLIVAALGAEPPERTIQFHLSVLGLDETLILPPPPSAEESAVLGPLLKKLDTKRLTAIAGEGLDHALVLDGWFDLGTTDRDAVVGRAMEDVLPEGDLEGPLRRYIDDSVNLLSELEINARRRDAGVAPLSVLWPWGHGGPRRLPNLALRRGEAARVETDSLRVRGLARLVGYRPSRLDAGLEIEWGSVLGSGTSIVAISCFEGLEEEQGIWLAERMGRDLAIEPGSRVLVVAPNEEGGLIVEVGVDGSVPFRADVARDDSVPAVDLWRAVDEFLTPE